MNSKKISALANAKINLQLDVLNKRADGYHNISSIFQSVTLADEITVTVLNGSLISVTTSGAIIEGENLVKKAAELFLKHIKTQAEVNISLKKNIPLSAGVGGGSSDAAAVLLCLNKAFSNLLSESELLELGLILGADVPFCIIGGTAIVEGIGEKLTPLDYIGDYDVVLVKQHKKASSGEMYSRIDSLTIPAQANSDAFFKNIKNKFKNCVPQISHNSFLYASYDKSEQEKICKHLLKNGAVIAGLSGSGPTVFGLFKNIDKTFAEALKNQYKEVYICKTAPQGIKIIE